MTELLAQHDKIENKENLNPEELKAIKTINNFFDKNNGNDIIIKEWLEGWNTKLWEEFNEVKEAYELVKNDITFSDAYTPEKYADHKTNITWYLNNNFWHLKQDIKGLNFTSLHPDVLQAKLYNYNISNFNTSPIDIPRFMTNFKAEYIQYGVKIEEQIQTPAKIPEYNKDQEHIIGKIFEVPDSEKAYVEKLIWYIQAGEPFDLDVFWQSDGTAVKNPEFIWKKYNTLRSELLAWCNAEVQKNLETIFPLFDAKNYPDKASWNVAFAKTRGLAKLSYLKAEDKNTIFAGDFLDAGDGSYKIGKTNFRFNTVSEIGNEHTLWKVSLKPSLEGRSRLITDYMESYLQNINAVNTRFHITYPAWTNLGYDNAPDYDPETSNKVRSGQSKTARFSSEWISAEFMINKASDWKSPKIMSLFKGETHVATPESLQKQSHWAYLMNILISSDDIVSGKYDDIFVYKITKDQTTGKDIARYVQLKDGMSFEKAMGIFAKVNKDNPTALQYVDNVSAALNNFDVLAKELQSNDKLRMGVAKDMFSKWEKSMPSYWKLGDIDRSKNNAYYKFLEQIGVSVTQSKTTDGKIYLSFNIKDNNGKTQKIGSKLFV